MTGGPTLLVTPAQDRPPVGPALSEVRLSGFADYFFDVCMPLGQFPEALFFFHHFHQIFLFCMGASPPRS